MSMKFYSRCLDIDRTFGPFLVPALCVVVSRTLSQCPRSCKQSNLLPLLFLVKGQTADPSRARDMTRNLLDASCLKKRWMPRLNEANGWGAIKID